MKIQFTIPCQPFFLKQEKPQKEKNTTVFFNPINREFFYRFPSYKTDTQNIYFKLINFNFQIKKKEAISYNLLPVIN